MVGIRRRIVGPPGEACIGDVLAVIIFRILVGKKEIPALFSDKSVEPVDQLGQKVGISDDLDIVFHDPDRLVACIVGVLQDRKMA